LRANASDPVSIMTAEIDMSSHSSEKPPWRTLLTPRENQVAGALAAGLTYKEVAAKLGISFHTVNTHAKSILIKSGLRNSRELAAKWRE
jgi:DNA-binding NarL/FixJ family response regulator